MHIQNQNVFKSYILILLSVCHRARVLHRRPIGPGPTLPDSRISTDRVRRGECKAGSVTEGRPALWSPARVERAQPFSGSQHWRCGHGHSLVPSTGGAWPGGGVLRCCMRKKRRRRRTEQRREEKKKREEKSVAWKRSVALLQAREEEEEDRGEKRRREEKRREDKRDLDWSWSRSESLLFLLRFSRVFKQEVLSLVFSRWCC